MHTKITLKNGTRIIYEKVPGVRSVSLCIWVATGSRYESAAENGSSHYIEHMVFKGTETRSAEDLACEMDALGGQINAFTTKECTCFYGKVLDKHLGRLADVLCDMLFNSRFDESDVENERGVISEEIDMYADAPEDLVSERLASAVFKGSALARPVLGTKRTLSALTGERLRSYMATHYTGPSVVVSLSGSFTKADIEDLMKRFSQLPFGVRKPPQTAEYSPAFTSKRKPIEQNNLCLGFPGITDDDERRYAFSLMSNILGGGMSSRLFQSVRESRGLCYSVYSYTSSYSDTGLFAIYTALNPDTEREALSLIVSELDRFRSDGVTASEVDRVREQAKANLLMSLESTSSRASRLGRNELLLGYIPDMDSIIDAYDRVTADEIRELSREFIDFSRLSFSAVGRVGTADKYRELFENMRFD